MKTYKINYTGPVIQEKLGKIDKMITASQVSEMISIEAAARYEADTEILASAYAHDQTYSAGTGLSLDNNNSFNLNSATANSIGGIKIGNNLSYINNTLSLESNDVISALGYTPITTSDMPAPATSSVDGLMSAVDKTKLNSIDNNANYYQHPTYTSYSSNLYKIATDQLGHITAATAINATDINTVLGYTPANSTDIPTSNTINNWGFTSTASDILSALQAPSPASNSKFLREDGSWSVPEGTGGGGGGTNDYNNLTNLPKIGPTTATAVTISHTLTLTDIGTIPIPSNATNGQILKYSAAGATWANENTYSLPTATSQTLGGVTIGSNIGISDGKISFGSTELIGAINALSPGTSSAYGNDYLIAQCANGDTTDINYYRCPVSLVVNASVVKTALEATAASTTTSYFARGWLMGNSAKYHI